MHVRVLVVGGRPQEWVATACEQYTRRLPPAWRLELVELPGSRRSPRQSADEVRSADEARIVKQVGVSQRVVALDERGHCLDSHGFAERLQGWFEDGRDLAFVIGGPDGLSAGFLARADFRWSLSPLTFPHEIARLLLVEQLYRAHSIISGHPYHRA